MRKRGLLDVKHKKRLEHELIQVDVQDEYEYFLDAYDSGYRWNKNHHNVFVSYLLGLCEDFDITRETNYIMGELPDFAKNWPITVDAWEGDRYRK